MASDPSDSASIQQALRGDQETWKPLVEKHMNMVFLFVLQRITNFHDAQDITQEVFLQAYTRLSQLRDPDKLAPWLRRIALNLCRTWYRRKKAKWLPLEAPAHQEQHLGLVASQHTLTYPLPNPLAIYPDSESRRIEASEIVQKGLQALSATLHSTFSLYYADGLTYQEIAARLDVPEGTVKRRLHDARRTFMEEVSEMVRENILLKYAVGLETWGGEDKPSQNARIFGRGLHLPAACTMDLSTAKDDQQELYFHLLQGDSFLAAECRSIGEFLIKGISPRKKGEPQIKLTLKIDASGKLQLRVKELPDKPLVVEGEASSIAIHCESE